MRRAAVARTGRETRTNDGGKLGKHAHTGLNTRAVSAATPRAPCIKPNSSHPMIPERSECTAPPNVRAWLARLPCMVPILPAEHLVATTACLPHGRRAADASRGKGNPARELSEYEQNMYGDAAFRNCCWHLHAISDKARRTTHIITANLMRDRPRTARRLQWRKCAPGSFCDLDANGARARRISYKSTPNAHLATSNADTRRR